MAEGLQRYQIMEALGEGSQGHTFRGIDRRTGDEVAIKVLQLRGATDWKAFELFEREAKVLAGLRHRGIPRFRDSFASEQSGDYFLVMDKVEGRTLAELIEEPGAMDAERLQRIMLGVLDVLEYLHGRTPPVVHRDIKPANIMIAGPRGQERVHLVDFGGVRVAATPEGGSTMIGTFGYMAPEQLHGEAGPQADLYALGATMATAATGVPADELPHEGLAIDLDAVTLPPGLRPVLAALLAPDPRDRVASVAEVRALLDGGPRRQSDEPARGSRSTASSSSAHETDGRERALAVPGLVQELAESPKPFSILVWITALLGAGALLIIEYAILPVVFLILKAVASNKAKKKGEQVGDDEAGITTLRQFRRGATRQRELVQYVIHGTSPLRDEPPALPPGEDDRKR